MEEKKEPERIVNYMYNFVPYFIIGIISIFLNDIRLGKLFILFSFYNAFNGVCINVYKECLERKIVKSIKSPFEA